MPFASSSRREALAAALLLAAAAALLLGRLPGIEEGFRGEYCRAESDYHVERGEALLHGVPLRGVERALPSYSVPNAFLCGHLPASAAAAVRLAVLLACAGLVFVLGVLLHSPVCGAAAALLYAIPPPDGESGERWLYALAVLLAAYFLVRRAQERTKAASAGLAAGIGGSFLILSSLCLFPVVLAADERVRERRARWGQAALCAAPFLFLLPWIAMNWRLSGRFVLFEDGRVDDNILTGALGFVRTMGIGDSRKMSGLSMDENVYVWAAARVLRHPWDYLSAVLQRGAYAASLHPLLVLAAAASAWLSRRRDDVRRLALLAAYIVGIHCLMPVQANYFAPAWPLLAVLAAGLAAGRTRPSSARAKTLASRAALALFVPAALLHAATAGLALAYPSRARDPRAFDREIARRPDDAWLRSERGMRALRDGRPAEAVPDLARALALGPSRDREADLSWALLARGGPAARVWERRSPGRILMVSDIRERILRGIYLASRGRRAEAVAAAASALGYRRSMESAGGSDVGAGTPVPHLVLEIIASWPAPSRPALIEFFSAVPGFEFAGQGATAEAWLDMADTADRPDQRRTALEILAFNAARRPGASDDSRDPEKLWSMALAYRDIGEAGRALSLLERPALAGARRDDLLLDMASEAAKAGRRAEASRALSAAERARLEPAKLRRLALLYRDAGDRARSLAVMKRTDMSRPEDLNLLLDLAGSAAKDGRRAQALEVLAFARSSARGGEPLRAVALAYRDLGDYALALDSLRPQARAGDAAMLFDLAVRAARDGRRGDARASLAFAETLSLDAEGLRGLASAWRALGDARGSERARRRLGDLDGLALDRAEAAAASGDRSGAAAQAARVREEALGEEDARRLVLLRQGLGDYSAALAVVERRARARPGDARWRSDAGVLRALQGRPEEAAADWRAAIALDPDLLEASLSLGSLEAARGRRKDAERIFAAALSRPRTPANAGVLERLRAERTKLAEAP